MKKLFLCFFLISFVFATSAQVLAQSNTQQDNDNPMSKLWDTIKKKAKELVEGIKKKVEELLKGKNDERKPEPAPVPKEEVKPEEQPSPKDEPGVEAVKPYIGFRALQLTEDARELLGLQPDEGLLVKQVYLGSPAENELKVGDVLLKADEQKLSKISDLSKVMKTKKPGDSVTISGLRDSKPFTVTIILTEKPEVLPEKAPEPKIEPKTEPEPKVEPETEPEPEKEPETQPNEEPKPEEPKNLDELLEKFYKDGDIKDPEPSKGLLDSLGNSKELMDKLKELFKNPEKMKELMDKFLKPEKSEPPEPEGFELPEPPEIPDYKVPELGGTIEPKNNDKHKPDPTKLKVKLGIRADNATPKMLLKGEFGVQIIEVYENTPAEKAGFLPGDILIKFAGVEITNKQDLADVLGNLEPGSVALAIVLRDGNEITLKVNL